MKSNNVQGMLRRNKSNPSFYVGFLNLGRGLVGEQQSTNTGRPYVKESKSVVCWRIIDNKVSRTSEGQNGILFDAETYLIQWTFVFVVGKETRENTLYYYWKGQNATKAFSPLPPEIENEEPIIERITQWSEPTTFFHMFPKNLLVISGKEEEFDPNAKRLFIVRGELKNEMQVYEVPCLKESLRSRTVFILVDPENQKIFYWNGAASSIEYQNLIRDHFKLNEIVDNWKHFQKIEVKEGEEGESEFLKVIGPNTGDYHSIRSIAHSTPRLFYFNSITGEFLATEIEYTLRSDGHVAPFPFLQSHLYTATQPALFLLDNDHEVWLWEGWKEPESDLGLYKVEQQLAKETAIIYSIEKEKFGKPSIPVKHILAGFEPIDFINIFPYWIKRTDVAEMQLKQGQVGNVNVIKG